MSDDGTRKIIKSYQNKFSNIKMIDNPEHYVPSGFNRILSIAKGDIILRLDGHAKLESDYISNCLKLFKDVNAQCVGGPIKHEATSKIGSAIKIAQSSKFGSGGATFRKLVTKGQYVSTLAFGAYKRKVFEILGGYDEELRRNQDDEFNFRMLQNNMRLWIDPSIKSTYYPRNSFLKLYNQYFGYGKYKVRVIQKRKGIASVRHIVPMLFFTSIIMGISIFIITKSLIFLFSLLGIYLFICFLNSIFIIAKQEFIERKNIFNKLFNINLLLIPFCYFIMHFSYGLGFFIGLITYIDKWSDIKVKDYHFDAELFNKNNR